MKLNKQVVLSLLALTTLSALYRLIPGRPLGFAPQIAIAVFGGALFVQNKKWAFILPLASMFLSDCLFELMFRYGMTHYIGFYSGQITNYLLLTSMTVLGFYIQRTKIASVAVGLLAAPTAYFVLSNGVVWLNGGGYDRPKTLTGLLACYTDALPFYGGSLAGTVCFGTLLFVGWHFAKTRATNNKLA